jgi:hypothetical protein
VAAGGGDTLLSGSDGIAEPADAPDALAAFVGQGVIDQERDAAKELEPGAAIPDEGHRESLF